MAKRERPPKSRPGEQLQLLDVGPKNSKLLLEFAGKYREIVSARCKLTAREVELKNKILAIVNAEKLQRLDDGRIKFTIDGYTITLTPRDMLVKVEPVEEAAGAKAKSPPVESQERPSQSQSKRTKAKTRRKRTVKQSMQELVSESETAA